MKKPGGAKGRKRPDGPSPLMRQYYAVKEQHPDKILFFRMGDFYEMFGDDAVKAAPILGIALTSRSSEGEERIPLAGVPYHAAEKYLARLVEAGEKVVIVEQVEDPKTAKGIVKREIVEIITPGTATLDTPRMQSRPSYLAAVYAKNERTLGLAALDLSTGDFMVDEGDAGDVIERLRVIDPTEIIYPADQDRDHLARRLCLANGATLLTAFEEFNFDARTAERELNDHFGTTTLDGFGVARKRLAVTAAGAIFRYLRENFRDRLAHIRKISRFENEEHMFLDYSTVRNLELTSNIADASSEHSLLAVINHCHTAAGTRRLQSALLRPFKTKQRIELRLTGVAELVRNRRLCHELRQLTKQLPDLERLAGRLGIGKLSPRQMGTITVACKTALQIKENLSQTHSPHLMNLGSAIPDISELTDKLDTALVDELPLSSLKGDIIRRGHSPRLDDLNDSIREARTYISSLQASERKLTKISSLKVGFNKVFGYYIEITKANAEAAPDHYIRKQTLVNAERYITPELKEKEELILAAEEKIFRLESELYAELTELCADHLADIICTAELLAELDLVSSLAEVAVERSYCRPEIFEDERLVIEGARHPVIEAVLPPGSFVANDVTLGPEANRIHILTGPNMSGKSTYLRQIGLIVILAQIGSFVPADSAEIGLVDRVFTRVGALDNLARGQSTFLVEMVETANILNHASGRSLVLLDEVGRGTSTFDGLSIAWAVVEHINENSRARTLFATHYHELTGMAELYPLISNYQVAVKKWEDRVIFLHRIIPGGCDDSYGIEVAKLAGLPRGAIARARRILRLLESGKFSQSELGQGVYREKMQPGLFDPPSEPSPIEEKIRQADLDNMSPMQALDFLRALREDTK